MQPQNDCPAFTPRFDVRFTIVALQSGQCGASVKSKSSPAPFCCFVSAPTPLAVCGELPYTTIQPFLEKPAQNSGSSGDNQPGHQFPPERRSELFELGVRHGVDERDATRINFGVPATPSAPSHRNGFELIYRYFERTLMHERYYQYFGQDQDAFTFSAFRRETQHYFAGRLEHVRHFGFPQPTPGSFPITDFGFNRTGIYMDDLRFCPQCGWFYNSDTPYIFDAIKHEGKPFHVAISAMINVRKNVPEFVFSDCGATRECAERRREQEPPKPSYEEKLEFVRQRLRARRRKAVYLIQAGQAYKIGIASNVNSRISALQSACPLRLVLIKTWKPKDARAYERALHARLGDHRLQNEWFALPLNIVTSLAKMDITCLTRWLGAETTHCL